MASVIHIECDECGGKSVVKIPTDYQDSYRVECCPLCGAPHQADEDLDDE